MLNTSPAQCPTGWPRFCPGVPPDVNGRQVDTSDRPDRLPAGWHVETRPQKDCVFRVLATARRGDDVVEVGGQWEQDALDNLHRLLQCRFDCAHQRGGGPHRVVETGTQLCHFG